ncbi:hypothetical protein [Zobellella denitrificans]|uniref:hypothetical protein n=1 Tax=Zobellella denitrificans TaxID=347534 RepID=UPI0012FD15BB|nr:hypothetical protein [Zobellella denitrificans]
MDMKEIEHRGFDHSIYMVASQFFDAANYIPKGRRYAAYVVNLAFSIELFIKSLDVTIKLEFHGDNPFAEFQEVKINTRIKGHSLLEIFNKLPSDLHQLLIELYENTNNTSLMNDLESIQNAFVDYRYLFEKESVSVNISALERVAAFLKSYIESVYR